MWFASCWDEDSVDFIDQFDPPAYKIASASLTDDDLLRYTKSKNRPIILSTGMSNMPMIEHAVDILGQDNLIILHCTSTYPGDLNELNLAAITTLQNRFDSPVGYSGHEVGLVPSVCATVLGAKAIERHITLNRAVFGSDQAASIEPRGISQLVKYIRAWEAARGDGNIVIFDSEKPIAKKLRRNWGIWPSEMV
jgi:N-acetylneuraminate synthase